MLVDIVDSGLCVRLTHIGHYFVGCKISSVMIAMNMLTEKVTDIVGVESHYPERVMVIAASTVNSNSAKGSTNRNKVKERSENSSTCNQDFFESAKLM